MEDPVAPGVHVHMVRGPGRCSVCGAQRFQTEHGQGPVFGPKDHELCLHFGDPNGPPLLGPIDCERGHRHAPYANYLPQRHAVSDKVLRKPVRPVARREHSF